MTDHEKARVPKDVLEQLLTNLVDNGKNPQINTLPNELEAQLGEFSDLLNEFQRRFRQIYEPTIIGINRYYALVHQVIDEAIVIDEDLGEEHPLFWGTPEARDHLHDDVHERVISHEVRSRLDDFFETVVIAEEIGLLRSDDGGMLLHNRTE